MNGRNNKCNNDALFTIFVFIISLAKAKTDHTKVSGNAATGNDAFHYRVESVTSPSSRNSSTETERGSFASSVQGKS
ncbi:MAG: hypothetical protein ACTHMC_14635 [Pseudobacter sp.]|uniref:hypothetical protein n=1 Tax=Pseudobacter sp. TaxID=2045420 RepID=UPI003F8163B4